MIKSFDWMAVKRELKASFSDHKFQRSVFPGLLIVSFFLPVLFYVKGDFFFELLLATIFVVCATILFAAMATWSRWNENS